MAETTPAADSTTAGEAAPKLPDAETKLEVFISYSRSDAIDFADQLAKALIAFGHVPIRDLEDISGGEAWKSRLREMIQTAHTVVFLLTPGSVASEICAWEVEEALRLGKRVLPAVFLPLADLRPPPGLTELNFIHFYREPSVPGSGFGHGLQKLDAALKSDLKWMREHRNMLLFAESWAASGRHSDRLLRGQRLIEAETWRAARPLTAPELSDTQRTYLEAARAAENKAANDRAQELAEMAAAQDGRQKALDEAEAAWRRSRLQSRLSLLLITTLVGLTAFFFKDPIKEFVRWNTLGRYFVAKNITTYVLTGKAEAALKPGHELRECASVQQCPTMIVVPKGQFLMGSAAAEIGRANDEGPRHSVTIQQSFAASKFEITFDQWDTCVEQGGCDYIPPDTGWGRGARPVVNVTWQDAQKYVRWLSAITGKSYRLMTEAEWEYAARSGTDTRYFWGDDVGKGNANCDDCGSDWQEKTAPVGSFAANAFGLHDMAGNAAEWVQDCFVPYQADLPSTGAAVERPTCHYRVLRGGSWSFDAASMRSATRLGNHPESRLNDFGFRVARDLSASDD